MKANTSKTHHTNYAKAITTPINNPTLSNLRKTKLSKYTANIITTAIYHIPTGTQHNERDDNQTKNDHEVKRSITTHIT